MNQVIVELDDRTLKRLDKVAPAKARRRSEFIREAIRRALDSLASEQIERAYRRQPQAEVETDLDPATWEPVPPTRRSKKAKAR